MPYPKYQIHFDPSIFTSHMMLVFIYLHLMLVRIYLHLNRYRVVPCRSQELPPRVTTSYLL